MELVGTAEEGGVGGMPEPALAREGGMDKGGGEADADDYLPEKVIVAEDLGYDIGWLLRLAIHAWFDPLPAAGVNLLSSSIHLLSFQLNTRIWI